MMKCRKRMYILCLSKNYCLLLTIGKQKFYKIAAILFFKHNIALLNVWIFILKPIPYFSGTILFLNLNRSLAN